MKAIPYSEILKGVADRMQVDADDLERFDWHAFKRAINRALTEAWEESDWPQLRKTELRRFHPDYDSAETVAAGEFRFFPPTAAYYQALQETTGNAPATLSGDDWDTDLEFWAETQIEWEADTWSASESYDQGDVVYSASTYLFYQAHTAPPTGTAPTDTDYWGEVTALDPVLPWVVPGLVPIGMVLSVTNKDPNARRGARDIPWVESVNGIQIRDPRVVEAWVRWKRRQPKFTGDEWDATVAYTQVPDEDAVGGSPGEVTDMALIAVPGRVVLRARTQHVPAEVVYLSYLVTAGDGQGGMFEFFTTSTAVDDGVDYIKPDDITHPDPGRWVRSVNP